MARLPSAKQALPGVSQRYLRWYGCHTPKPPVYRSTGGYWRNKRRFLRAAPFRPKPRVQQRGLIAQLVKRLCHIMGSPKGTAPAEGSSKPPKRARTVEAAAPAPASRKGSENATQTLTETSTPKEQTSPASAALALAATQGHGSPPSPPAAGGSTAEVETYFKELAVWVQKVLAEAVKTKAPGLRSAS